MSLNQLIDTSNVAYRKWLNAKVNSLNILEELKFANTAGTDGQIVSNVDGLPFWTLIQPVHFQPGGPNTYLYTNGSNTVEWSPLNCQIASYFPYGKVDGGGDDPSPQDIGSDLLTPTIVEFQGTLFSNPGILSHPNLTDFIAQKSGIFKVTFCGVVFSDDNSIGFGYCINEVQNYEEGWCTTSPIDTAIFPRAPGFRNGAGSAVCMVRFFYLNQGDTVQVLANKQYQTGLGNDNYFVGQKSASISFEYLGQNYTLT